MEMCRFDWRDYRRHMGIGSSDLASDAIIPATARDSFALLGDIDRTVNLGSQPEEAAKLGIGILTKWQLCGQTPVFEFIHCPACDMLIRQNTFQLKLQVNPEDLHVRDFV